MTNWEPYNSQCPCCGYPESRDFGPYEEDLHLGPINTLVHILQCGRCLKYFDVDPDGQHAPSILWNDEGPDAA